MIRSEAHRYQVLDSLRGVCACMVVMYHFHTIGLISNLSLFRNSFLFVDFFFVLSGFVISTAYRKRLAGGFPVDRFMWLRLGRVYPLHLFILGLFFVTQVALLFGNGGSAKAFQGNMSVMDLVASITLTQAFVLPQMIVWNYPSWSIAVEVWTYLFFAFIFRFCRTKFAILAICISVIIISVIYIVETQIHYIQSYQVGALFRCTYGFALGVIGAELYKNTNFVKMYDERIATYIEIFTVSSVILAVCYMGSGPFSMLAPPLFLMAILIFAGEFGAVSEILKKRAPLMIGKLSYSIYMVHIFILYRFDTLINVFTRGSQGKYITCGDVSSCSAMGSTIIADLLIIPMFFAVLLSSYLTWRFIESPCQDWSRRYSLRNLKRNIKSSEEKEASAL